MKTKNHWTEEMEAELEQLYNLPYTTAERAAIISSLFNKNITKSAVETRAAHLRKNGCDLPKKSSNKPCIKPNIEALAKEIQEIKTIVNNIYKLWS